MKEMNAEMPAVGIMKLHEYPDAVWYDVACECGSKDHYHSIWIEADSDTKLISVGIGTEGSSDYWTKNLEYDYSSKFYGVLHFVDETIRRLKLIWKILTKGYVKYESHVLLNEQQALNYAETLKTAISDIHSVEKAKS